MCIVARMANPSEWTDQASDAARQAAEQRETGGASVPAGGTGGPGDLRAPAEEPEPAVRGGEIRNPDPEEVPELLGERSDYPLSPSGAEP